MKTRLILCPVDFSACSALAVQVAGRLARNHDLEPGSESVSKVILLHVNDPAAHPSTMLDNLTHDAQARLRDQGQFEVTTEVEYLMLKGKPSSAIVEFANTKKVDLIVMGTRGQSGLRKLMLGSVAEAVMRDAHCPVIAVKP